MHCSKNPRLSAATLASYPGMLSPLIAVVEAEAVTAAPDLRDWLISLAAFARSAVDRHVGVVFVIS